MANNNSIKSNIKYQKRKQARIEKLEKELRDKKIKEEVQAQQDRRFMKEAIKQAKKAYLIGETPIGCIIIDNNTGDIIARGYNQRNKKNSVLAHAEITALSKANKYYGDWRLEDSTMYVTLEPCPMCAGAIVQARLSRIVIGAMNSKAGCAGSIYNMLEEPRFNHQVSVTSGVLEEECSWILKDFFKKLRKSKNQ